MLFDLWGRGYSDCCVDLDQDDRFYFSQIMLAIISSPLSWTGGPDGGFSIVGYSMGGGIATAFAAYFPKLVKSLVLLAPAGLIRAQLLQSFKSWHMFSEGLFPQQGLHWLLKRKLRAEAKQTKGPNQNSTDVAAKEMNGDAL